MLEQSVILRLSGPDKQRAIQIVKDLKRRQIEERIQYFEPTKPPYNDQFAFLNSPARVRFVFGGNRSGKTEIGAADVVKFALGIHPVWSEIHKPPIYGRICAPKYIEGCKGVILKKLRQMIPHRELVGGNWLAAWKEMEKTLSFKNGSTFKFKSFEQDLNTFGGDDLHFVWDDEHCSMPYFIENFARLTDYRGYYIKTMTPEAGQTWELDYIGDPPEGVTVDHWYFSTKRNPYLDKEGVKELESSIKDPNLRATKIEGEFMALTGLVIPQFNKNITVVPDRKLHPDAYRVFCIDLHPKAPSAALWAAWEPDEKFGQKLVVYRTIKKALDVDGWKKEIKVASVNERIDLWLGDETERETGVKNMYNKDSIISEFNKGEDKLPIRQVEKPPNSYYAGIFKLWNMFSVDPTLGRCQIEIFESCNYKTEYINGKPCGSLVWELSKFAYKKEQKADEETLREQVRKINDHLIDDVRYIAQHGPGHVAIDTDPQIVRHAKANVVRRGVTGGV